jgi:ribosomal protein L30E
MQITVGDLNRLQDVRHTSHADGILSVYLPIDPVVAPHRGYVADLMNTLRELRDKAPPSVVGRLDEEAARVLAFVRTEYVPNGSCLMIFSSMPADIWEVFSFQLPVKALARFGEKPYFLPVAALSEDFAPTMVALVDHREARFYSLRLGELLGEKHFSSDVMGYSRQGGWAAFRFEKERQHDIGEHLRRVVEALKTSDDAAPFENLLLAGTDETTHALTALLPHELQHKLTGTFRAEMFATDAQLIDSARGVLATKERERELDLTQRLIQTALEGGQAALGLDETLQMLREGRARSLVLSEDAAFGAEGETAYALAESAGLPVEFVHAEAAVLLEPYAGLAAQLRY